MSNLRSLERRFSRLARNSAEEQTAKKLADVARLYANKPVEYATEYLGKLVTPKQKEILESLDKPPYRTLARSANNQGKCVHPEDRIPLADGSMVLAKDLVGKRFQVLTMVEGKTVPVEAYANWDEPRPCYKITLDSGEVLRRTGNHPLWSASRQRKRGAKTGRGGWVNTELLTSKHLLAVPEARTYNPTSVLSDAEAKFLGYLFGAGVKREGRLILGSIHPGTLPDANAAASELGYTLTRLKQRNQFGIVVSQQSVLEECKKTPLAHKFAERFGLRGKISRERRVPNEIFAAPLSQQILFLSRLLSVDAWIFVGTKRNFAEIGYCSSSEQLCRDVQELLSRVGVRSSLDQRPSSDSWICRILSAENVRKFCHLVGIYGRDADLQKALDQVNKRIRSKDKWRKEAVPAGCRWERIESVEKLEEVTPTVAITVPGHHTFLTHVYEHNTFIAALKACHHFDTRNPSETLLTAPSAVQVRDSIFKEIRALRPNDKRLLPKDSRLQDTPLHYISGLNTAKPDAFQGRHPKHLGLVFDEATSIDREFFSRADTMFQSDGDHWWLASFNPNDPSSYVYQLEQTGLWHTIELSALEHPNVLAGLRGDPIPFPGAITLGKVQERLTAECEAVRDHEPSTDFEFPLGSEKWYRVKTPEFESQVLGRWPLVATQSLFSPVNLDHCCQRRIDINTQWGVAVGCDVARFGEDKTVIAARAGPCLVKLELHSKVNTTWIAQRLREVVHETLTALNVDTKIARSVPVYVDDSGGYGSGVLDQHEGFNFIGINNSCRSPDPQYPNMRTYLWCCLALMVDAKALDFSRLSLPEQQAVKTEFSMARYRLNSKGQREIDPKSAIKKQLGRSPDRADAITLAFFQ